MASASIASPARARAVRLQSHGLRTLADDAAAVVERLGAVQAQDLGAAKWAIGSRMSAPSPEAVDAALAGRRVIRSWPMRGTLHILPTRLLRSTLVLTSTRVHASARRRRDQLGLGEAEYRAARRTIEGALAGGRSATREELAEGGRPRASSRPRVAPTTSSGGSRSTGCSAAARSTVACSTSRCSTSGHLRGPTSPFPPRRRSPSSSRPT
nr:crosslink repair DNA glycosylase YcaQ family protein [Agromyces marinus]